MVDVVRTNHGETVDMTVIVTATAAMEPSMGIKRKCRIEAVTVGNRKTVPPPLDAGLDVVVVGNIDDALPVSLVPNIRLSGLRTRFWQKNTTSVLSKEPKFQQNHRAQVGRRHLDCGDDPIGLEIVVVALFRIDISSELGILEVELPATSRAPRMAGKTIKTLVTTKRSTIRYATGIHCSFNKSIHDVGTESIILSASNKKERLAAMRIVRGGASTGLVCGGCTHLGK